MNSSSSADRPVSPSQDASLGRFRYCSKLPPSRSGNTNFARPYRNCRKSACPVFAASEKQTHENLTACGKAICLRGMQSALGNAICLEPRCLNESLPNRRHPPGLRRHAPLLLRFQEFRPRLRQLQVLQVQSQGLRSWPGSPGFQNHRQSL